MELDTKHADVFASSEQRASVRRRIQSTLAFQALVALAEEQITYFAVGERQLWL
jgi:hypothetical protein